ncbi:MAG: phospholipid carrier-dependent glycosyltransferase, partial [Rhodospirillales bacterium]
MNRSPESSTAVSIPSHKNYDGIYFIILLLACAVSVYFAFHHDIFRHFTSTSDNDVVMVYEALMFNSGLDQFYFDHPGYIYFLILGPWLTLMKALGFVSVNSLSELGGPSSTYAEYAQLVFAGRFLSIVLVLCTTWVFHYCVRGFVRNRFIAVIATALFSISPGMVTQSLIMRTELPAILFVLFSFAMLLRAVRAGGLRGIIYLGLCAFAVPLALLSKVQILPIVMALPILAFIFHESRTNIDRSIDAFCSADTRVSLYFLCVLVSLPAITMYGGQIYLFGHFRGYQVVIALYAAASALIYGRIFHKSWNAGITGLFIVMAGFSLGHYSTLITNQVENTFVVANVIEHMTRFSSVYGEVKNTGSLFSSFIQKFYDTVFLVLSYAYVRDVYVGLAENILYWIVTLGGVFSFINKRYRLGLQIGIFLFLALGMIAF